LKGEIMSQFYANIKGNRGQATRRGTKKSGLDGHIRGWHIGAKVYMRFNEQTQEDECTIELTGGSNGYLPHKQLGTFTVNDIK